MKMLLLVAGVMKNAAQKDMLGDYLKRIKRWKVEIREYSGSDDQAENWFCQQIPDHALVIIMDETGSEMSSTKQAEMIRNLENTGEYKTVIWVIGGADGHGNRIRQRADQAIRFGRQTWPHMLARIMLIEQIYRTQEIIHNTPYHREG